MLVELIEDQAHAVHEAIHVRRLSLVVCCTTVRGQCFLERFEVLHPLQSEVVGLNIGFVEY